MNRQGRRYLITINNFSQMELEKIKGIRCQYCCYCLEKAPTTGTSHLHAFVIYKNGKRKSTIIKEFPRADVRHCNGSIEQNLVYVRKHGNWHEYGEMPQQGKRNDLILVAAMVTNGNSICEIAQEYPSQYIRYSKGIEKLKALTYKPRTEAPIIYWIYGETGVGKTRTAVEKTPDSYYIKDQTKWWDGYRQQKTIIIDDFEKTSDDRVSWPFRDLLRLLDRYPYQGQFKGGYIHINSKYIYITSEFPPTEFWSGTKLAQIKRRITESKGRIIHMFKPFSVIDHTPLPDIVNSVSTTVINLDNDPEDDNRDTLPLSDSEDEDEDEPQLEKKKKRIESTDQKRYDDYNCVDNLFDYEKSIKLKDLFKSQ